MSEDETKGPTRSQQGHLSNRCSRCPHGSSLHHANGQCLIPECECPGYEPDLTDEPVRGPDSIRSEDKRPKVTQESLEAHRYKQVTPRETEPDRVTAAVKVSETLLRDDPLLAANEAGFQVREKLLEKSEVLRTSHKGGHYHDFAIEPIQVIEANHLNFHQGNIIKYVMRYNLKDGVDDLKKARFYLDRLIEITE